MKNIDNKKIQLDPMAEARKHFQFKRYSQDAYSRIDLAIEMYDYRKKEKLSQKELAVKAFTTQKVISKIENADMNMSWDLITRVLNALGLTLKIIEMEKNNTQLREYFPLCESEIYTKYFTNMCDKWEAVSTKSASNKQLEQVNCPLLNNR